MLFVQNKGHKLPSGCGMEGPYALYGLLGFFITFTSWITRSYLIQVNITNQNFILENSFHTIKYQDITNVLQNHTSICFYKHYVEFHSINTYLRDYHVPETVPGTRNKNKRTPEAPALPSDLTVQRDEYAGNYRQVWYGQWQTKKPKCYDCAQYLCLRPQFFFYGL